MTSVNFSTEIKDKREQESDIIKVVQENKLTEHHITLSGKKNTTKLLKTPQKFFT